MPTCPQCDVLIARTARLIVRLRHFAAAVHRLEHHPGSDWLTCGRPSCTAARITIEKPEPGRWDHLSRTANGQYYVPIFQDETESHDV